MPKPLSDRDFSNAARRLRCDAAAIRAVAAVESSGAGFLSDGRVKVLLEGHWFHRYTQGRFAERHPDLSYPRWTTAYYALGRDAQARGAGEWERLSRAMKLDRRAAMLATSRGRFQIMGFNFAICGHTRIESFVRAMRRSWAHFARISSTTGSIARCGSIAGRISRAATMARNTAGCATTHGSRRLIAPSATGLEYAASHV